MKLVQACLTARVHLVQSTRKHRESSFNHRGEPVKHMEACISAWKDRESSVQYCGCSVNISCKPV